MATHGDRRDHILLLPYRALYYGRMIRIRYQAYHDYMSTDQLVFPRSTLTTNRLPWQLLSQVRLSH